MKVILCLRQASEPLESGSAPPPPQKKKKIGILLGPDTFTQHSLFSKRFPKYHGFTLLLIFYQ